MSDSLKRLVALSALNYIPKNIIVGIGSGSTVKYFIEALTTIQSSIIGTVSSSLQSKNILKYFNFSVFDLNSVSSLDIYVDGADEVNKKLEMIKGGGGALTQEKIIASVSKKFLCIVDESKYVDKFHLYPVPIEIIPMSLRSVSEKIIELGGYPKYRKNFITDNGNWIIDIFDLSLDFPVVTETLINNIPGVVSVGLFCKRKADILLVGCSNGIKIFS